MERYFIEQLLKQRNELNYVLQNGNLDKLLMRRFAPSVVIEAQPVVRTTEIIFSLDNEEEDVIDNPQSTTAVQGSLHKLV